MQAGWQAQADACCMNGLQANVMQEAKRRCTMHAHVSEESDGMVERNSWGVNGGKLEDPGLELDTHGRDLRSMDPKDWSGWKHGNGNHSVPEPRVLVTKVTTITEGDAQ